MSRPLRKLWFTPLLFLSVMLGCSTGDDPDGAITSLDDYQRIALWDDVLSRHPDLPDRLREIVANDGQSIEENRLPESEVVLHTSEGSQSFRATSIDVIVTDLSTASLEALIEFLERVPERAKAIDIGSTEQSVRAAIEPVIMILGSNGRMEISGPGGSERQSINVFHHTTTGEARIKVHAFGPQGQDGVDKFAEYMENVNGIRGPPESGTAYRRDVPRPTELKIIAIGELSQLDISGPREQAEQRIAINSVVRDVAVSLVAVEAIRTAKAAHLRSVAAKNSSSRSRTARNSGSSRSRPSSVPRPRPRPIRPARP